MIDWRGVITNAVSALIGAVLGFLLHRFRNWRMARGQGALLHGLEGATIFVFPTRPSTPKRFLPNTAIEDFLAVNNTISAFLRAGMRPPSRMRDHERLTAGDRKSNNLILICSSKSNDVTRQAIDELRLPNSPYRDLIPYFENVPGQPEPGPDDPVQIQIRGNGAVYQSLSYTQGPDSDEMEDVAMIVKVRNPWSVEHTVLIIAGVRGIGTWGAAEMLKKWWEPLHHSLAQPKNGDFAAIVRVHYKDHDIKGIRLLHLDNLTRR